jgi:L-alanine-DL-glutamate epimerase-like enolase superfamily enzyme
MKIQAVKATAVRVPVERPTSMSNRLLDKRDYVLVEITAADGTIGIGYTYTGTSGAVLVADAVDELFAPMLVGGNADDIVHHWGRLYQETLMVGRRGAVIRALSAIDLALWDLSGKRRNTSLAALLGAGIERVPAYASGGYYRPDEGEWVQAVRDEIQLNISLGFSDHKIKVGGLSVREDAARVAAAVEEAGPDGRVALDCNNAYRNVMEAIPAIRAFEDAAGQQGLWWVEEPLAADDIEGHAEINRRTATAIATGEIHATRWEFRTLLSQGAADLLQPDVGVLGGVTEWMRVAHAAETFGVPVAPHWHANAHVHVAAAAPNCLAIEYFPLEKDIYNFEHLLEPSTRLQVEDGHALVPDRPGLGIELDKATVRKYTLVR